MIKNGPLDFADVTHTNAVLRDSFTSLLTSLWRSISEGLITRDSDVCFSLYGKVQSSEKWGILQ